MAISGKASTAILFFFFFFLLAAPTTAEIPSPMVLPSSNQSFPTSYPIEYSIHFESCSPKYNFETHYSSGLTHLSYIYLGFSLVYLLFLGVWTSICLKTTQSFRRIHFLQMAGLIVMKGVTLICAAKEMYIEKITGSDNGSELLYYVRQIITYVRLLIVSLLIRNGWPHVKPILQEIDRIMLMIVIPEQVFGNVTSIVMGETNVLSRTVDSISGFLMMIPFTLSCFGIVARVPYRLELYRVFCVFITFYLMLNRMFTLMRISDNFKLNAMDDYYYLLNSNVAVEVNSFVFYVVSFRTFWQFFHGNE